MNEKTWTRFKHRPLEILARQLTDLEWITTTKGETQGKPGEWVCRSESGQVFILSNTAFLIRYRGIGKQAKQENRASEDPAFTAWYASYPRKVARVAAAKAWKALKPNPELIATMNRAIDLQTREKAWFKSQGRLVPQWPHPATWLNGQRWADKVEGTIDAPLPVKPLIVDGIELGPAHYGKRLTMGNNGATRIFELLSFDRARQSILVLEWDVARENETLGTMRFEKENIDCLKWQV